MKAKWRKADRRKGGMAAAADGGWRKKNLAKAAWRPENSWLMT